MLSTPWCPAWNGFQKYMMVACFHLQQEITVVQMLTEMDGFQKNDAVVVMAATNRPAVLDTALTRPGRFDRLVHLTPPNKDGRIEILKVCVFKAGRLLPIQRGLHARPPSPPTFSTIVIIPKLQVARFTQRASLWLITLTGSWLAAAQRVSPVLI